jgi:hypothetical protein
MSMGATPIVRLAPLGEPGANLYNAYHYITQISGLYAQAAEHEAEKVPRGVWGELCDRALLDLGDLYHLWEEALREGRAGRTALDDTGLGVIVNRACGRMTVLVDHMNVWTPMARWARVLQLCERRWLRMLERLEKLSPAMNVKLSGVRTSSLDRVSRLTGLLETYHKAEARTDACFKVDGGGPFGGAAGF